MSETEQLREQVAQLLLRISVLERQVLQAKDQIIGDHARNGELMHRLTIAQKNNKKLRDEIKGIHSSTAWRMGRLILSPVRTLKFVARKLR
jgi:predicted  nucleic acid-binding Zn-ribbon protein